MDKKSSFDAEIPDKEISGLVRGTGKGLVFELIPKEKQLAVGDLVVTSSLGGIFPPGILVGRVKEIKRDDTDPFQQAELEPTFNITETGLLFLIKGSK